MNFYDCQKADPTVDDLTLSILIIDNNPDEYTRICHLVLNDCLIQSSFNQAHSFDEAQALICKHSYDLILLDPQLPDYQGLNSFSNFMSISHTIPPVIILSTTDDPRVYRSFLNRGALDCLYKPKLTTFELTNAIRNVLARESHTRFLKEDLVRLEELEQAEIQSQEILNHSSDCVIVLDNRSRLLYLNPAAEEIFKKDSLSLRGQIFGFPAGDGEIEVVNHKQGDIRTFEMRSSSLSYCGEASILIILRDITDRVNLETQLRQSQKLEAIGRLAGGVAHDFNNHLTTILGYAELARDVSENDDINEALDNIKLASSKSAALTAQLLSFSRKQVFKPAVTDINEHIIQAEKLLSRLVRDDIELKVVQGVNLAPVYVDPVQIDQIIMNLVINAEDAMEDGGVLTIETSKIELDYEYTQLHPETLEGSYVQLAVIDNGKGMDEITKSHIFEPFFTTKASGKGTGLGLSTVHGIVKQCGGHIWVYSEPGRGTIFKIYLPVFEGAAHEPVEEAEPSLEFNQAKILVVEDQPFVRDVLVKALTIHGFETLEAENGTHALHLLREHRDEVDLLLTDIIMPKMGGTELACNAQDLNPAIKIIFMSGYTETILKNRKIMDNELAFLQKPITPTALVRKVVEVLNSPRICRLPPPDNIGNQSPQASGV